MLKIYKLLQKYNTPEWIQFFGNDYFTIFAAEKDTNEGDEDRSLLLLL